MKAWKALNFVWFQHRIMVSTLLRLAVTVEAVS